MLKGLCVEIGDQMAKIKLFDCLLIVGRKYKLVDITNKTLEQNGTFHDLIDIFYDFMFKMDLFILEDDGIVYNLKCDSPDTLKDIFKQRYGRGFYEIKYADIVDDQIVMIGVPHYNDLPIHVKADFENGNRHRIEGKLYSWSTYSISQSKQTISRLIMVMDKFGVDTKKYLDMRKGFDKKELDYINRVTNKFDGRILS